MMQPMERSSLAADSLGLVMLLAARACEAVRRGQSLGQALTAAFGSADGKSALASTRAATQDLAFFTMRWRGRGDALLARLSSRAPDPAVIAELLVIALVILDAKDAPDAPHYSPHTLVDQAVEAAGALAPKAGAKALRGFVNAVLRRALARPAEVFAMPAAGSKLSHAETYNYQDWWVDRVRRAYPSCWQSILASGQTPAPLTLRVNLKKISMAAAIDRLEQAGIACHALSDSALQLERARRVETIDGFSQGLYSVQDEAAQRAAPLLDVHAGQRVLDAFAAPGGKTGHLLESADIDLTALDVDASRLARVSDNLQRLGLTARLVVGDAGQPGSWWDGVLYQRILADLPCSASGIVRRHPDIRWLRRASDIDSLSRRQQQLLDALWRLLTPDGKLLVVTCSIFPQEGAELTSRFLSRHADARALLAPGQLLPQADVRVNHDGLYYSLIEKVA